MLSLEAGHETVVGVTLAPELVLDDVTVLSESVELPVAELEIEVDEELVDEDWLEETEDVTSFAPQIEGAFTAAPRVFLR